MTFQLRNDFLIRLTSGQTQSIAFSLMSSRLPELLSPAGNWDCARAAVASGADAIYFGLPKFNARMRAKNFTEDDLPELMKYLHRYGVKGYVAMNTLIFTEELDAAIKQLQIMEQAGVDGVIVQDLGLSKLVNSVTPRLELHASTQMTLTSPEGLAFASRLFHLERAVLARELSLKEIERIKPSETVPIEVFVHGALCVAYSGQCLTSESLGQRSANRGECAQACRMPYDLIVDGVQQPMDEVRYLLSPQDLAAVDLVPELVNMGVVSYKIEGRLKSPEYVAAVTKVYRRAIDDAIAQAPQPATADERYRLEMTFSRGQTNGWLDGTNHPNLTHGKWGKKRGPVVGTIEDVIPEREQIKLSHRTEIPIKAGDGFVIDEAHESVDRNREQGGKAFRVQGDTITFDKRSKLDWSRIKEGQILCKTADPALDKAISSEWRSARPVEKGLPLNITVSGSLDHPLTLSCNGLEVHTAEKLEEARNRPLNTQTLQNQLGKLGGTGYALGRLENELSEGLSIPLSALNRARRALVEALEQAKEASNQPITPVHWRSQLSNSSPASTDSSPAQLRILCRHQHQIDAALEAGVQHIYADFEDVRGYKDAVASVRAHESDALIALATPRIQKSGEHGYFKLIEKAAPDGVLIRNLGAIDYFQSSDLRLFGDFSLNVANPLTADLLFQHGNLETLTISYDLNLAQVLDLLNAARPEDFELSLHHHMPMFHMEHCVFCTFMSEGTSYKDCGRPCEKHKVQLRDRVGQLHTLMADVGCRNTLFNGRAQTGARHYSLLRGRGLNNFRLELLDESYDETIALIQNYQSLLDGSSSADQLLPQLTALDRLGITEGTLEKRRQEAHL